MLSGKKQINPKATWATRTSDPKGGDHFPTDPAWTQALFDSYFKGRIKDLIWEPACGDGAISKVFELNGWKHVSSDLHDWGYGKTDVDFLKSKKLKAHHIVTNPPFALFDEFFFHGWKLQPCSLVLCSSLPLLGTNLSRYDNLFKKYPPNQILLGVGKMKVLGKTSMFSHVWNIWNPRSGVSRETLFSWVDTREHRHLREAIKSVR